MSIQYPEQRMDLLIFLATSQRVEIERHLAEIRVQKGQHHDALDCLRRLGQEVQDASGILASLQAPGASDDGTRAVENMLAQQLILITTQLADVEKEASRLLGGAPTPPIGNSPPVQPPVRVSPFPPPAEVRQPLFPPSTEGRALPFPPAAPRRESPFAPHKPQPEPSNPVGKYKPWPTADPTYSRPALEPISFGPEKSGPRVAGDMGGAVHIRRQLDEQEQRAEAAAAARWRIDIGLDPAPNPRKRPGDDDLPSNPNKRQNTENQPAASLRGGREHKAGKTWDLKSLWKKLFVYGKAEKPGVSNDNGNNVSAEVDTVPEQGSQPTVSFIRISALRTAFGPSDSTEKSVRDALANIVALCEEWPSRLRPDPSQTAEQQNYQRQQIQYLLDALNAVSLDDFDAAETQLSLRDLLGFVEDAVRAPPARDAAEEAAANVADLEDRLQQQLAFAHKVFVGGEATAATFARWVRTSRARFAEELEFGERACQEPRAVRVGRGFGRGVVYEV